MPKHTTSKPSVPHLRFAMSPAPPRRPNNPPPTLQHRRRGKKTALPDLTASQSTLTQLDFVCASPVMPYIPNSSDGELEEQRPPQAKPPERRMRKKNDCSSRQPTYTQAIRALRWGNEDVGEGIDCIRAKVQERAGVEVTDWRLPCHEATVPENSPLMTAVRTPTRKRTRWGSKKEVPSSQSPPASELRVSPSRRRVLRERSVNVPSMRPMEGKGLGVGVECLKLRGGAKRRKAGWSRGGDGWRAGATVLDSEEEGEVEGGGDEWFSYPLTVLKGEDDGGDAAEEAVVVMEGDDRLRWPEVLLDQENKVGGTSKLTEDYKKEKDDGNDSRSRRKGLEEASAENTIEAFAIEEDEEAEEEDMEVEEDDEDDFPATFNPVYSALDRDAARFLYDDDNEPTQLDLEPQHIPTNLAENVKSEAEVDTPCIPSTPPPLRLSQASTISNPTPPSDPIMEPGSSPFPLPPWSPTTTRPPISTHFDDGIGSSSSTLTDFSLPPPPPMSGLSG